MINALIRLKASSLGDSVDLSDLEHRIDAIRIVHEKLYFSLPTKRAVSLGLIINEIATNAIKYGFSSGEEALFTVDVHQDKQGEKITFTLSNSGRQFPEAVGLAQTNTLGLRIVNMLVEQLDGTIELQKKPHPVFTLHFPSSSLFKP